MHTIREVDGQFRVYTGSLESDGTEAFWCFTSRQGAEAFAESKNPAPNRAELRPSPDKPTAEQARVEQQRAKQQVAQRRDKIATPLGAILMMGGWIVPFYFGIAWWGRIPGFLFGIVAVGVLFGLCMRSTDL